MLGKLLTLVGCLVLTIIFGGCADFEYSEPGVTGFYEPHYYYDRYPRYYHGSDPRHYVHAYRAPLRAPVRAPQHVEAAHGAGHEEGHDDHR